MTSYHNEARPPKYPRTPYLPTSPSLGGDTGSGRFIADPGRFVGHPVVVTEKLDGSCTLIHRGQVYARSVSAPSTNGWMAMVKKHHAWKVFDPDVFLYGEDIYGVHAIHYDPVREDRTFYAFGLRDRAGMFLSFRTLVEFAHRHAIATVPVLF